MQFKGDSFNWEMMANGSWRVWVGVLKLIVECKKGYWCANITAACNMSTPLSVFERMCDVLRAVKWSSGKFRNSEKAKLNALQAARHIVAAMQVDLDRLEASLLKQTRKAGSTR